MRLSGTRWHRLPELCAALVLAGPTLGCVSTGAYDALVEERDQLREERDRLEEVRAGFDKGRVEALGQAEDLREERDRLARDVTKLTRRVGDLEAALAEHERARQSRPTPADIADSHFAPLRAELEAEVAAGRVFIGERPDGLRLVVAEEALFASGSGQLTSHGKALLDRIALRVRDDDQRVEVEGGAPDPKLRLGRGASVMRALTLGGVPPEQLRAGSFPDEGGEDEALPARRGAEIRLLPNLGAGPGLPGVAGPPSEASAGQPPVRP